MALPAHVLDQLGPVLTGKGVRLAQPEGSTSGLALGMPELDAVLPDGGLVRGGVVELAVGGEGALGTSLALAACRSAQAEAVARGREVPWCAFVDPSGTLYAPGVAAAGVELSRLLVVRPSVEALSRVALRVAESGAFSVVVVDLAGVVGERVGVALGTWPRIVRRLSLAVEQQQHTVVLLTRLEDRRPLPLPVAQRIELTRTDVQKLWVRVAKDQRGRIGAPRPVAWTRGAASDLPERVDRVRKLA